MKGPTKHQTSKPTGWLHMCIWRMSLRRTKSNDPKFLDRYAWANSAEPYQTAPRGAVWSGPTLFAILSASFGHITLWWSHIVQILKWLQQIFWVSEYLGNLQYHNLLWWLKFSSRKNLGPGQEIMMHELMIKGLSRTCEVTGFIHSLFVVLFQPRHEKKPVFGVFNQVWLKPACAETAAR